MTTNDLFSQITKKQSFLCVGLDTDMNKIPAFLLSGNDPLFQFNKSIIDATAKYTVAYKPNLAFYEIESEKGWASLRKTVEYIKENYPEIFIIADAKRGDIGNTSEMYAKTFFETFNFDAVTLSPYMGKDTVAPFLQFHDKWSVLLALTSNTSASDFQYFKNENGQRLFEKVIEESKNWGNSIMYVVGATKAEMLADIRKLIPNHFLLIPGVGAQGGSLSDVAKYGMNSQCGLLVNSSRAILYADNTENYALAASKEAEKVQIEMKKLLEKLN